MREMATGRDTGPARRGAALLDLRAWLLPRSAPISASGRGVLGAALLLLVIGLVTVYSASFYRALVREQGEFFFLRQQLLGAGLGLFALYATSRLQPRRWLDLAPVGYLAALALLLLVWSPIGISHGGANRWVDLGVIGFQPSELAKIFVPLMVLWYLRLYGDVRRLAPASRWRVVIRLAAFVVLPVALVLMQPDLGTAVFLGAIGGAVFLAGGIPLRYLLGLLVPVSPLLVWQAHERWGVISNRVRGMLEPESVDQVRHALTAIRAGGLDGAGLGRGTEKTLYLYAEFSDFIFAVFAEETGLIGVTVLLLLYVGLLVSGWRLVLRCRDLHLRLFAFAIVCNLIGQALMNLTVNTAMMPTKGIALPFISHGSTGLSVALLQVGILLSISRLETAEGAAHPATSGAGGATAAQGEEATSERDATREGER